jgi:hypothetical protein
LPVQPQISSFKAKLGKVVHVALRQENSCLITFHTWHSITDFTGERSLAKPVAKQQNSARKASMAMHKKGTNSNRGATAQLNMKDRKERKGLKI